MVTRGRGRFALDSGEQELGRGELVWFLPHTGHELVSSSADFDMWVVAFRPELVALSGNDAKAFERAISTYRVPSLRLQAETLGWLEGALQSTFQLLCAGRAPEPALMGQVLARVWRETIRALAGTQERLHSAARRARTLLSREPWLGRLNLAERLAVSESTLAHVFRRDVGVPLDEYRNRVRLGRLLQLLDASREPLLDVALAAGFGSAAQYHRSVRALAGCRPSELKSPVMRRAISERVRNDSARSGR